jgi:Ig domain of plant-specific actin-binding protein
MRTKHERRLAAAGHTQRLLFGIAGILALGALLVPGATLARGQAAPASTASPQILGTTVVGNTLTATSGTWSGSSPIRFGYRWLSCPGDVDSSNGAGCHGVGRANTAFYRVRLADLGAAIRARVIATNAGGTARVVSDATSVVQAAGRQPVSVTAPAIAGKPLVGKRLTAKPGLTAGARPISYVYQWHRCDRTGASCSTISGASGRTYSPTSADVGHELRVRVVASNSAGTTWSASSPTSALAPVVTATAPQNTGEPRILGTPSVGSNLTATRGTWSGSTPMSIAYRWRRCPQDGGAPDASNCAAIPGATGSVYRVRSADAGLRLRVRVTATNSQGSATAASNPTDTVRGASSRPVNTSAPTISGTTEVGQTLTANAGNWSGQSVSFAYRWRRCDQNGNSCSDISGATAQTYSLKQVDAGNTLRVRVTGSNSGGSSSATSAQTSVVRQAPAPGPGGVINLPGGLRSIPATSVPKSERLVMSVVHFEPSVVTSRSRPITIRVRVFDSRGFVVRGALVFARATPRVTSSDTGATATDGWISLQLQPLSTFPLKRGAVQFFLRAYRTGDPLLAGISSRRLVQVIVRP